MLFPRRFWNFQGLLAAVGTLTLVAVTPACQTATPSGDGDATTAQAAAVEGAGQEAQSSALPVEKAPVLPRITPEQAKDHVGEKLTVCGKVMLAVHVQDQPRQPTYLNFGRPYPDQVFSVIIRNEDRDNFPSPPETLFADQDVCATGMIAESEAGPQMRVESPEDVVIQPPGS